MRVPLKIFQLFVGVKVVAFSRLNFELWSLLGSTAYSSIVYGNAVQTPVSPTSEREKPTLYSVQWGQAMVQSNLGVLNAFSTENVFNLRWVYGM